MHLARDGAPSQMAAAAARVRADGACRKGTLACSDLLPAATHTHTDQGSDQAYQVYLRASRHVQHDKPGS